MPETTTDLVWDARVEAWQVSHHPDGRMVWVIDLMFTSAIVIGDENAATYDDRWCYTTRQEAFAHACAWLMGEPMTAEPTGWHRHPPTGRRRVNGDPTTETVSP